MEKVGFFDEGPGVKSSMRLMCFMSFVMSAILGFMTIQKDPATIEDVELVIAFLVAAFAPKAIQKWAEKYGGKNGNNK